MQYTPEKEQYMHQNDVFLHKMTILLISMLIAGINVQGQSSTINNNEKEIKLSGAYIWAEYPSMNRQQAIDGARREVSQKISTTIFSSSRQRVREQFGRVQDDYSASTSAISMLSLKGLNFIPKQKRDGSYDVLAYISKKDLEASFNEERRRQLESWRSMQRRGEEAYRSNEFIGDIHSYYIDTYFYPYTIFARTEDEPSVQDSVNIAIRYEELLSSFLDEISINIRDVKSVKVEDATFLEVEVAVARNEPINSHVQIRPEFPEYPFQAIRGGVIPITIDRLPSSTTFDLPLELRVFNESLPQEIIGLASEVSPVTRVQKTIDVSDLIDVGISVQKIDQTGYSFFPRLQALNIESLTWMLNGQEKSTQPSLSLLISDISEGDELLLVVNDDQALTHKMQYSSGQWLEVIERRNVISSASNEPMAPKKEKTERIPEFDEAPIINELKSIRNGVLLVNRLNQLSSRGLIDFGNQRDVPNQSASYIVIINPNSRGVEDILSPEIDSIRVGLLSELSISDYKSKYRGYGSIFIFIN